MPNCVSALPLLLLIAALSTVNLSVGNVACSAEYDNDADLPKGDHLIRIDLVRASHRRWRPQMDADHPTPPTPPPHGRLQFASLTSEGAQRGPNGDHLLRMQLLRHNGFSYAGEIHVGRPARPFRVLLDSGSGELWLPASGCPDVDGSIVNTYDHTKSSSFREDGRPVKVSYVNGVRVMGRLARDTIQFGDHLLLDDQLFVQVDRISDARLLQHFHIDGILGLSLQADIEQATTSETPIRRIMRAVRELSTVGGGGAGNTTNNTTTNTTTTSTSNTTVARSVLSLSLNGQGDGAAKAGELIIGGLDESRYVGQIAWAPLMRSNRWRFRLDNIQLSYLDDDERRPILSELSVCEHGCEALADTGTMMISGPARDIEALNQRLGAHHVAGGAFVLPSGCKDVNSRLPRLVVTLAGVPFSLKPSQYTFEHGAHCFTAFSVLNANLRYWILGNMFIGHLYTILDYDNERIGLAESPFKSDACIVDW